MTEPTTACQDTETNIRIVDNFLYALQAEDFDAAAGALDENVVYQNVGFSKVRGRHTVKRIFQMGQGKMALEVKIHRSAADGVAVLNERTDALIFGPLRIQFWVCGVFEVHQGQITLWRDYFDNLDIVKGLARGLVGIAVPSLRPRL
ncbi:MAG: limonene-1,2-epoxide hydrolase family protein [Mycobacterium sp.]